MSGDHNMYGDGNVYRGQRSKDSETKTMTSKEQIAQLTAMLEIQQKLQETAVAMIKPAIEIAVQKEREACAKVLDEMADDMAREMEPSTAIAWVRSKASEIRARSNT